VVATVANLRIRAKDGKTTTILWTVKKTSTDPDGSSHSRFYALRSDGSLLVRSSYRYLAYGRVESNSSHWKVPSRNISTQEKQAEAKAWLLSQGYVEVVA
jgi:hypothetical protein